MENPYQSNGNIEGVMLKFISSPNLSPILIQYFYSGLLAYDRNAINVANDCALNEKLSSKASDLSSTLLENSPNLGTKVTDANFLSSKEVIK